MTQTLKIEEAPFKEAHLEAVGTRSCSINRVGVELISSSSFLVEEVHLGFKSISYLYIFLSYPGQINILYPVGRIILGESVTCKRDSIRAFTTRRMFNSSQSFANGSCTERHRLTLQITLFFILSLKIYHFHSVTYLRQYWYVRRNEQI